MRKLFYRFKDDIYVDFEALSIVAKEFGVQELEVNSINRIRSKIIKENHLNLIHVN